jgi:thioredoxin 1
MIKAITDQTYADTISTGKVLIDFWAPWCGPCRMLASTIDEVANEVPDLTVGKVNVDDYPELAESTVAEHPTLLFIKEGEIKDTSIAWSRRI